jgi:hypothetical protein
MKKLTLELTALETTFLIDYFLKVRLFVDLENEEEIEIEKRIYEKIKDSGYLDSEVDAE